MAMEKVEVTQLLGQLESAKTLMASRVIKTEEGRELLTRHIQLLETLIHGKPITPSLARHHA